MSALTAFRDLTIHEAHRATNPRLHIYGEPGCASGGAFMFASPVDGAEIRFIASAGDGWDHVSVSRADRCPTWEEMEFVRRLVFLDHAVAMQLHVPPTDHINIHNHCLHMWRPHFHPIPLPPKDMV